MPLYFFDLCDGRRTDFDDTGLELRGAEAAFEEAVEGSRDMLKDAALRGQSTSGWAYQVRDEAGRTLFTVLFSIATVDQHYKRGRIMVQSSASSNRKGPHLG